MSVAIYKLLSQGVLPDSMLSVLLVSVLKTCKLDFMKNYRLIALASVLWKVLEVVLLDILKNLICTGDNQFGFRVKHGP